MDSLAEQTASRVTRFIKELEPKYPIMAAYLFGSWADNQAGPDSDIDIGIVLTGTATSTDRREIFSLGKEFDIDFDIVVISEHDFATEDPVIVHEMKTKGIRVA